MAGCKREVMEPSGREKVAAAAALVAGLVGMWFMLAYSYVYINCAVFPVAGALIAYAYDVAERTVAARKECCRKVETRRAYRAARASEYGAWRRRRARISKRASAQVCRCAFTHPHNWVHIWQRQGPSALPSADAGPVATRRPRARRRQAADIREGRPEIGRHP